MKTIAYIFLNNITGRRQSRMLAHNMRLSYALVQDSDMKRLKAISVLFPLGKLAEGILIGFVTLSVPAVFTDILKLSWAFTSFVFLIQMLIAIVASVALAALVERTSFKKARYYPWLLISLGIFAISCLAFYFVASRQVTRQWIVLACASLFSLGAVFPLSVMNAVYPQLVFATIERVSMAIRFKGMRIVGAVLFLLFQDRLLGLAGYGEDPGGALLRLAIGIGCPCAFMGVLQALLLRNSYVERRSKEREERGLAENRRKIPLRMMVKLMMGNHVYISLFLYHSVHKAVYLLPIVLGGDFLKYMYPNAGSSGPYMILTFYLPLFLGLAASKSLIRLLKGVHKAMILITCVALALALVNLLTSKIQNLVFFVVGGGLVTFCQGIMESIIPALFASACDYGAWKAGRRIDGIVMSIYTSSVATGLLIVLMARAFLFSHTGIDRYNRVASDYLIKANEAVLSLLDGPIQQAMKARISTLFAWMPLLCGIMAVLTVRFWFHLNDRRMAQVQEGLMEGKTIRDYINYDGL